MYAKGKSCNIYQLNNELPQWKAHQESTSKRAQRSLGTSHHLPPTILVVY